MNKKPLGLRFLRVLAIIVVILDIISIITIAGSLSEYIYVILDIVFVGTIIFAVSRPRQIFFKTLIILSIVNLIADVSQLSTKIELLPVSIAIILIDVLIIWYFLKAKGFFFQVSFNSQDISFKKIDRRFVILFVVFIMVFLIVTIVSGALSMVSQIKTIQELGQKDANSAVTYCKEQNTNVDRCVLMYIASRIQSDLIVEPEICRDLTPSGQVGCYALIQRCDLVIDSGKRATCEQGSMEVRAKLASSTSKSI